MTICGVTPPRRVRGGAHAWRYAPPVAETLPPLDFACPRCGTPAAERYYGPCGSCREALGSLGGRAVGAAVNAPERYVPKMNVVPNQVATKD